jgi:hypothetical protein
MAPSEGRTTGSQPTSAQTHDQFHLFPKLPSELRLLVWSFATLEPRRVRLDIRTGCLGRRCNQPVVLTVNKESRISALERYIDICPPKYNNLGRTHSPQYCFLNPHHDFAVEHLLLLVCPPRGRPDFLPNRTDVVQSIRRLVITAGITAGPHAELWKQLVKKWDGRTPSGCGFFHGPNFRRGLRAFESLEEVVLEVSGKTTNGEPWENVADLVVELEHKLGALFKDWNKEISVKALIMEK